MKWYGKLIVIVALIGAVVFIVENKKRQDFACASGVCTLPIPAGEPPAETVKQQTVTEKTLPRLLDLGAGKCIPCKLMAPILDEMEETFADQLVVDFIDVWENPDAAKPYNIRMIPTQIFYDAEGKELFHHEGFFAREDMLAKWKELGYGFAEPKNIQQGTPNSEGVR